MAQSVKIRKYAFISIAGLGITVGSLAIVVPVPVLVIFGTGSGIILGGIFKAINTLARAVE